MTKQFTIDASEEATAPNGKPTADVNSRALSSFEFRSPRDFADSTLTRHSNFVILVWQALNRDETPRR